MSYAITRRICCAISVALLSGCSIIGEPVKKVQEPQLPPPPTAEEIYARVACQPDPVRALSMAKALLANDPDNVATQLVHAYTIEQSGRPVEAWEIYISLAEGGYFKTTSLTCNNALVYNGSVSDIARFRSQWLAERLKAQGVVLAPAPKMATMTPPEATSVPMEIVLPPPFLEPNSTEVADAVPVVPVEQKQMIASVSKNAIFVHLASYKGPKSLGRGWQEISGRHKALLSAYTKATRRITLKDNKGTMLRLGVEVPSLADARTLCTALKAKRQYCMVMK